MANETLSFNVLAKDNASSVFKKVGDSSDTLHSKLGKFGTGAAAVGKTAAKGIGIAAAATTALGVAGLAMGVKTAAGLQQAQIGFETMLGSGRKAQKFLGDLKSFAAKTPFELPGLIENSRMLLGVGVSAKNVLPILQDFGDAAGALGIPQESFSRAMLAMSQSISAGKIKLGDMNQLMNAGLPIWQLLSQALHKPVPEIQSLISHGKLMTDDVLPKLQAAMHKDYGGAMEKQSQTLSGLWSTFMDTLNIGLADSIMPLIPALAKMLPGAMKLMGDGLALIPKAIAGIGNLAGPLVGKIREAWPQIKTALDTWRSNIGDIFQGVVVHVAPIVASIRAGITSTLDVVGDVKAAIDTGNWTAVGTALGTAIVKAVNGASAAVGQVTTALGNWLSKVDWVGLGIKMGQQAPALVLGLAVGLLNFDMMGLLRGVVTHWQDILWAAIALWLTPVKIVGKVAEMLARIPLAGKFLAWVLTHLKTFTDDAFRAVGHAISRIGGAFLQGFREIFPGVGESFARGLALLPLRLAVVALDVAQAAGRMMNRLREAIVSRIEGLAAAAGRLAARLLKPLVDLVAPFARVGLDLVTGLAHGIASAAHLAWEAAISLADSLPKWVRKVLGIGSPSKVMIEIGHYFTEGLTVGIKDGTPAALTAVKGFIDRVSKRLDDLRSQARSIMSGVRDAMTGALDVGALGGGGVDATDAASPREIERAQISVANAQAALANPGDGANVRSLELDLADAIDRLTELQNQGSAAIAAPGVNAQLSDFATQAQGFSAALAKAVSMGLNPTLIAKVAALGPIQGMTAAQALGALNSAQVAQANASLALADKFANSLATTIVNTTPLPAEITRAEKTLATLLEVRDALKQAKVQITVHSLDADAAAEAVLKALLKAQRQHGGSLPDLRVSRSN